MGRVQESTSGVGQKHVKRREGTGGLLRKDELNTEGLLVIFYAYYYCCDLSLKMKNLWGVG